MSEENLHRDSLDMLLVRVPGFVNWMGQSSSAYLAARRSGDD
jgi:hypothetical protein